MHFSYTQGKAPHYVPEIICKPFSWQGKPVLRVEEPVEALKPEEIVKKEREEGKK
jgi:hypothetical protein